MTPTGAYMRLNACHSLPDHIEQLFCPAISTLTSEESRKDPFSSFLCRLYPFHPRLRRIVVPQPRVAYLTWASTYRSSSSLVLPLRHAPSPFRSLQHDQHRPRNHFPSPYSRLGAPAVILPASHLFTPRKTRTALPHLRSGPANHPRMMPIHCEMRTLPYPYLRSCLRRRRRARRWMRLRIRPGNRSSCS